MPSVTICQKIAYDLDMLRSVLKILTCGSIFVCKFLYLPKFIDLFSVTLVAQI